MGRPKLPPQTEKRCARCRETKPAEVFSRDARSGRCASYCRPCKRRKAQQYQANRRPPRRPKVNARGDVWCPHCRRYLLATSFRRHPAEDRWWTYCQGCCRDLDRQRKKHIRGTPEWARDIARRATQQRAQQRAQRSARIAFVKDAILIVRRRGLTKAEIAKLIGSCAETIGILERGARLPTPAMAERFVVLLRETAHLPAGREPASRRRLPHPELPVLLARCRPQMDALPVRSRWTAREE